MATIRYSYWQEISMKLCNNNGFERDGGTYFFSPGKVLINEVPPELRGIYQYADGNGDKLIKTDTGFARLETVS